MMKFHCNVVRDLMPLVADGASSAESEAMVQSHINECAECRDYFRGLRADIPAKAPQPGITDAIKRLTKRRRLRIARNILFGIVIGLLMMHGISLGWNYLTTFPAQPAPLDGYAFQLVQLEDGSVSVSLETQVFAWRSRMLEKNTDGMDIVYLGGEVPILYHVIEKPTGWDRFTTFTAADMADFAEIRQGTPDNYATLWRPGDTIPPASAELERYFRLESEYQTLRDSMDATWTDEDHLRLLKLGYQYQLARYDVPEWRTSHLLDN